jgi:hypothetical protein
VSQSVDRAPPETGAPARVELGPFAVSAKALDDWLVEAHQVVEASTTVPPPRPDSAATMPTPQPGALNDSKSAHQAMPPLRRHPEADGVHVGGSHGSDRVSPEPEAIAAS